jgi:hypothetical protein
MPNSCSRNWGVVTRTVPRSSGDKTPLQSEVKPVWDKYGAKYAELIKLIQAVN